MRFVPGWNDGLPELNPRISALSPCPLAGARLEGFAERHWSQQHLDDLGPLRLCLLGATRSTAA